MSVKFVIDSASDLLPQEAEALGVSYVPMKIIFDGQEYADGLELSQQEFFEKLANCQQLPTTCQVPPADFENAIAPLVAQGDQVIVITLSSGLSGTYQSALIAAGEFENNVFVVDSLSAAVGERILLMRGLELAKQGIPAEQIASTLEQDRSRIRLVAILDTLENLKKGGRIGAATAFAGGMLAIKPAIKLVEGKVTMAGTARGHKKAYALLKEMIEACGGVNFHMPAAFAYAGNDRLLQGFLGECGDLLEGHTLPSYGLGCTIGTHVGNGAYGIAFFEK